MKFYIECECGKTTCAVEPGRFCRFTAAKAFCTKPWCRLFDTQLLTVDGWLQRCKQCLIAYPDFCEPMGERQKGK